MASTLDPSTVASSLEAFAHPLPAVRQFHRQLQSALDEKNARLRTLVGSSYRQLLDTAEMIVDMRDDIENVEANLGKVAEGCGRSIVSKKVAGLGKLEARNDGERFDRGTNTGLLARLKALDGCIVTAGRLLKEKVGQRSGNEDSARELRIVTSAMVLILSRLLWNNVSEEIKDVVTLNELKPVVEELGKKRKSLQRRLIRRVERIARSMDQLQDEETLIGALCAYSLTTNSGSKDVLEWFLKIRGAAIVLAFDEQGQQSSSMVVERVFDLYVRSLLDFQSLMPRRLPEALESLKDKPLLEATTIRQLELLRIDTCEQWFGDEITFFTPFIRHDDLDGPQAKRLLASWAKKASDVLLEGLTNTVQRIVDVKSVLQIRTTVLEKWISEGGKVKGFDSSEILDSIRKVFNDRLIHLVEAKVSKLHIVGSEVEATLGSWQRGITDRSIGLWDDSMLSIDTSNGAYQFKQGILAYLHGRNDALSRVTNGYRTWFNLIEDLNNSINGMKKQRWEEDLDDLDEEDGLDSRNMLLSTDDPNRLAEKLEANLDESYASLQRKFEALWAQSKVGQNAGPISMFVLRLLRDIRRNLPKQASVQSFGLSMVPSLHEILISTASRPAIDLFTKSTFRKKKVIGRALWEGSPELPVQPSPTTFKFLRSLSSSMATSGADLWSPTAAKCLKEYVSEQIGERWTEALKAANGDVIAQREPTKPSSDGRNGDDGDNEENKEGDENGENQDSGDNGKTEPDGETGGNDSAEVSHANGNSEPTTSDSILKDVRLQSLFDILLIRMFLSVSSESVAKPGLVALNEIFKAKLDLNDALYKRLEVSSKDYWRRTSLLFAMLN